MKTRLFAVPALLVGLTLLALIVPGRVEPTTAQSQQVFIVTPTPKSKRPHAIMALESTPTPVAFAENVGATASSPCAYHLPDGMCVYYGDLHSHTSYSDGQGTPQQAFQMARDNGLDFFATTDHAEQLNRREWNDTLAQAQAATVKDQFVALRGFEWTSNYGHLNVFGTEDLVRANDSRYNTLPEFYAWLSDPAQINSVAQFNHPFYPPIDPFDNWRYDALADRHVNLIETHNGDVSCVDKYDVALAAGWRVAATSNSDTHQANWGERRARTGIVAPGLTYHHVLNAQRARRTFSTDDENLALAIRADGYWMGSVIRYGPINFDVYTSDPDPDDLITTLELYRNGDLSQTTIVKTTAFTWSFSLPTLPPPGTWWYVKAIQRDGDEAYTSPIWTHQPNQYDVLIRDNMWDTGDVPLADPGWSSPDVWIRRQADGQIWHENPVAGEVNHVHARVQNIGFDLLTGIDVYLYWSHPSLGFVWPDSWNPINLTPAHIDNLVPGEITIVSVPWDVPHSVSDHACLLVRLVSAQDPIRYEGHPRWDNNIGWKNVHIVDLGGDPPGSLVIEDVIFYLANPFAGDKAADLCISSSDFPAEGTLALHLTTELFDRWMATGMGGVVKGAVVDPIAKAITITFPVDAVVYGLPLLAGESSPATLALGAPATSTLAVCVSEQIDGEEIGGNLYTTSSSNAPRKICLEAAGSVETGQSIEVTAAVVGDGFAPVTGTTEVRFSTTLGSLSADTVQTQNGLATVTLDAGVITGTAIVQAGVSGLVTATTAVNIYRPCWVRLNDDPAEYSTVQAAVDASTHPADVVKVAGRCTLTNTHGGLAQVVYISKTVTVRGGYTVTNWTASDPVANPTTLDAQGQGRVIYVAGDPAAGSGQAVGPTIEGLHITGGNADGLGGGPAGGDAGGGIYVISATATIKGNRVFSNGADYGGGLYLSSSDGMLVNNLVDGNQASSLGSGLYVEGSSPRLLHTTIARNGSAGLAAGDGSGVYVTSSAANSSTVFLTNTVLVSHTVGITVAAGNTATLEATLWGSDTWANSADWGGAGAIITGTRNYWGDPAFVDPGAGDYHIGAGSAALDAGVDAGVNDDVDGDPRPMGYGYDIGADELRIGLMVTKRTGSGPAPIGAPMTYTLRITNTGDLALHATVTDTLPDHITPGETAGGTLIVPGGTLTWTPVITAPGGVWTQQVVVTVEMGYAGPLTNVVRVTTGEGATDVYTHALMLTPDLEITKRATPDPVETGEPLAYTICVTNTGNVHLHATITDTLPGHIMPGETAGGTLIVPGGTLTWTPVITAPGGVWTQQIVVTVEVGYAGLLTNVVRVTTSEGATSVYTETTTAIAEYSVHLPLVMRSFQTPGPCAPWLITEVSAGPESRGVALDTAGQRAFVAHADGVTVIDTNDFAVITTTQSLSLSLAHGIAYDPDHDRIWVTRRYADKVVVLDGATYATLADLPAGDGPHSVAYNPANGRVYVTNYEGWTVSVYNATIMTIEQTLTNFEEPAHVAVNSVTNKVYVANHRPNRGLTVIDGATHSSHHISTALLDAYGVAVDATRNLVYATAIAQGRISIIDGATDEQVGHIDIRSGGGQSVWLRVIAVNPDVGPEGHLLLVTSSHDGERDQLLLIPNGWPTLGTPVPLDVASYPQDGIALDGDSDRVWVTSVSSGLVSVVQDGEPVCSIPFLASGGSRYRRPSRARRSGPSATRPEQERQMLTCQPVSQVYNEQ